MIRGFLFAAMILAAFPGAAEEPKPYIWRCIGCDPYTGTIEKAVDENPHLTKTAKEKLKEKISKSAVDSERFKKQVAASGLSEKEKERILAIVKNRSFIPWQVIADSVPEPLLSKIKSEEKVEITYEIGEIKVGEEIRSMVFHDGVRKDRVIARPQSGAPIRALVYTVEDQGVKYMTKLPTVCNNFAFYGYGLTVTGSPAPAPPKKEPAPLAEAKAISVSLDHTVRIRIWDSKTAKPGSEIASIIEQLKTQGPGDDIGSGKLQSRNLHPVLIQAAKRGEISPYLPCTEPFQVAFKKFAYEQARSHGFFLDGKKFRVPADFGPEKNGFEVAKVCNGEGAIAISRKWVPRESSMVIVSPWRKPDLVYPPSGRLQTAEGELHKLVNKYNASNYHFVK